MFTKKIGVVLFLVVSVFVFSFSVTKAGAVITDTEPENSYELCHNGLDDDDNGSTDMADISCSGFATEFVSTPENSYELCHNGLDDDDNGSTDMADISCSGFATEFVSTPENSYELCHNGLDDDDNGSTDMADISCSGFATEFVSTPENSYALCHNGLDDDDNGSTDMADISCSGFATEFVSTPENSYALCHNGLDDDDNGSTDMADISCSGFAEVVVTPTTPTNTSGGSSSGGSGGSRKAKAGTFASSIGEYSTATGTCQILTNHMKRGMNNNVMEVIVLQAFLNKEMGTNLPLTGFFGPLTEQAVKDFQVKYANDILKPWFDLSLSNDAVTPTGYVYKTTLYKINSILCEGIKLEAPVLN